MKPFVIGITGGIAGGKTAVTDILTTLGACVLDADVISRKVIEKGTKGEKLLKKAFPNAYETGELDRDALRKEVFSCEQKRQKLNAITHPLIRKEARNLIKKSGEKVVFFAVPLLFESGFDKDCDYTVCVHCDYDIRIKRLLARNTNLTNDDAEAIIKSQMSDAKRIALSDEVILNNDGVEELRAVVEKFYARIMEEAQ